MTTPANRTPPTMTVRLVATDDGLVGVVSDEDYAALTAAPARADIHTLDQRCHLCASDTELETLPVPADAAAEQCPFWTSADEVTR